jgi:hypothetical protein
MLVSKNHPQQEMHHHEKLSAGTLSKEQRIMHMLEKAPRWAHVQSPGGGAKAAEAAWQQQLIVSTLTEAEQVRNINPELLLGPSSELFHNTTSITNDDEQCCQRDSIFVQFSEVVPTNIVPKHCTQTTSIPDMAQVLEPTPQSVDAPSEPPTFEPLETPIQAHTTTDPAAAEPETAAVGTSVAVAVETTQAPEPSSEEDLNFPFDNQVPPGREHEQVDDMTSFLNFIAHIPAAPILSTPPRVNPIQQESHKNAQTPSQRKSSRLAEKAKLQLRKNSIQLAQSILISKLGELSPKAADGAGISDFDTLAQHLPKPLTSMKMDAIQTLVEQGNKPRSNKKSKVTPAPTPAQAEAVEA